jgi:glutathione S-transferase
MKPYQYVGSPNSRRVVPTLVLEDGTAIGEVPAILRYLEEIHPQTPLHGESAKERALVTMWERRVELEGFAAVMEGIRNAEPGLKSRARSIPILLAESLLGATSWTIPIL